MRSHAFLLFLLPAMLGGLPKERVERLPEPLLRQIAKDQYDESSEVGAKAIQAGFEYRKIDLNGDGSPEYFVQSDALSCGSAGCSLWIYRKLPNGSYKSIYDGSDVTTTVDLFEGAVLKSKTKGFADLLFKDEPATGGPYFQVLVFNGNRYEEYSDCR